MNFSESDLILIERYLKGELTESEKEIFSRQFVSGNDQKIKLTKAIITGSRISRERELSKFIVENSSVKKTSATFLNVVIFILIMALLSWVGITFIADNDSFKNKTGIFSFHFFKSDTRKDEDPSAAEKKLSERIARLHKTSGVLDTAVTEDDTLNLDLNIQADENLVNDYTDSLQTEEAIVVKKDELISSDQVNVIDKNSSSNKSDLTAFTEPLANTTATKLSDEDLPQPESPVKIFQVEFWQSPVNYHGYKMSKNKLVLFGINNPDNVKIIRYDNQVFLFADQNFFRINPSYDFQTFVKLKGSDVPADLKQ